MPTILFWNFPCRDDRERPAALAALAKLAAHHGADVLVLAETRAEPAEVLAALNFRARVYEKAVDPPGDGPRISFYTRFPASGLAPFRSDERIDIRRLRPEGQGEILLAAIHFFDRRNSARDEQAAKVPEVNRTLRDAEVRAGHTRTVLFGDLNMNPFDPGMINSASGFGAMPTRSLALRHGGRGLHSPQRFYNPTWSRMGRELPESPGTYYFNRVSKPLNIFWHHLDQVLVRPALFGEFRDDDFQVVTSVPSEDGGAIDLIRSTGKHWATTHSDHLPIVFRIEPPKEIHDA